MNIFPFKIITYYKYEFREYVQPALLKHYGMKILLSEPHQCLRENYDVTHKVRGSEISDQAEVCAVNDSG